MWTDPVVEEVRRIRQEYAREMGYDLSKLFADLRAHEQRGEREVVTRAPRRRHSREEDS